MGDDPAANKNYSCDFYDRDYMTALQDQLVSRVMDYPVRATLSSHPFSSATLPQTERPLSFISSDASLTSLVRSISSNEVSDTSLVRCVSSVGGLLLHLPRLLQRRRPEQVRGCPPASQPRRTAPGKLRVRLAVHGEGDEIAHDEQGARTWRRHKL